MKYFRDAQNIVFAYESDGSQDKFIKPGLIPITKAKADALRTPSPAVPSVITMRQARLALAQSGYLAQVDSLIAGMDAATKINWEFAQTVERSHPLVAILAAQLPLVSQQLDDLFTLAASL